MDRSNRRSELRQIRRPAGGSIVDSDAVASVPRSVGKGLHYLELGGYRLAFAEDHPHDREAVRDHWPQFADQIDLEEPFGRIREAIDEARQSAR